MASRNTDEPEDPVNLKGITREVILRDVIQDASKNSSGWMVLVLDAAATRIVSSVLTMFDIMEERVTLVESLEKNRQPFPEMSVVYIISTQLNSINQVIRDFSDSPKYGDVHLFFLSQVGNDGVAELKKCPALIERIKTFKEINVNYLATESQVFSFDERCFAELYGGMPPPAGLMSLPERAAAKLLTVCSTLHEFPEIRVKSNSETSISLIGQHLVRGLEKLKKDCPHWWYNGSHGRRPQGTLVLLDRADDMVTPPMHHLTYQAMVYDLLPIEGDKVTIQMKGRTGENRKTESLLNETDEFWAQYRHEPMMDVINVLSKEMESLKAVSAAESTRRVREQQEINVHTTVLMKHDQLATQCMTALADGSPMSLLESMSQIEQSLATNHDDEGSEIKISEMIEKMISVLPNCEVKPKLRLIILLLATQRGISDADYKRVTDAAGLTPKQIHVLDRMKIIINRTDPSLGEEPSGTPKKKGILFNKILGTRSAGPNTDWKHPAQRYTCAMKDLAETMVQNKLSPTAYPAVEGSTALAGGKSNVAHSVRRNQTANKKHGFSGPRSIIFCVGGITHEEMQSIYNVSKANEREVILGSTSIISPNDFLDEVMTLANDFDE